MSLIWLARGHKWGFKFLEDGAKEGDIRTDTWNPVTVYEDAFEPLMQQNEFCHQVFPGRVALRLKDPEGRKDQAGRFIYHDFVLFEDLAEQVKSVDDGLQFVWPLVSDSYDEVWDG